MAYVRKLPSGKWQATVYHPSGKRITRTDPLKRAVQVWAAETEARFRSGAPVAVEQARRVTVEQWWDRWRNARRVESATTAKNESHWRTHLQPRWGSWPLAAVGRLDVQTWIIDLGRAGVGAPTVHACHNLLAAMISDAVLEGLLTVSPCREIDLPKVVKPDPRWLARDEYARVMDALALGPRPAVWRAYVALGCHAGLRVPGEINGLDVAAVDFDRLQVFVSQVVTRQGLRAYPKNDASVRWAPFPPEVAELLWPLCADRAAGPLFTSPTGRRVNEANFRNRVWRPALEAAGVPYINPYSMRHTAASWLRQDGVPDADIAQILGHASTRMIGTYGHLDPNRHDRIRASWARAAGAGNAGATHAGNGKSPLPTGRGL